MSTTLGIKVDQDTRERLKALAQAKDRTPHWIMRTAIDQYLEREERSLQQLREDDERWERFVLTGEAVEHTQARAWLEALAAGEDEPCPA